MICSTVLLLFCFDTHHLYPHPPMPATRTHTDGAIVNPSVCGGGGAGEVAGVVVRVAVVIVHTVNASDLW